ncbi:hypothetical protein D8674_005922 [Pyrus ussuriensis x Pyrus communis]|uniref:Uncharacterized protein n=1 Tax=Pyrus ussuriensis x Pyrus communis TaxID=2448454 RepID=A0A5N5FSU9_9ROSA|nr:hypothetical protein D8674_005922 [Pyrus ussuriensis x Pyrus communis]
MNAKRAPLKKNPLKNLLKLNLYVMTSMKAKKKKLDKGKKFIPKELQLIHIQFSNSW